jgi:hypothetical protein
MPVTRDTATAEQISNFLIANSSAGRALDHAILVLQALPAHVPFEQRAEVELQRANAIAQRAVLQAEFLAFMSEQGQIEPPDATVVSQVEQIAADIDQMTANATALVGLVNGLTNLINAYRGAAAPAGAAAAGAMPAGASRGLGPMTATGGPAAATRAMSSAFDKMPPRKQVPATSTLSHDDARLTAIITAAVIDVLRKMAAGSSKPPSTSKKKPPKGPKGGKRGRGR